VPTALVNLTCSPSALEKIEAEKEEQRVALTAQQAFDEAAKTAVPSPVKVGMSTLTATCRAHSAPRTDLLLPLPRQD